ncbi:MAG: hypothetical protein WC842_04290 [Candidatus Paceibacterota bacterium]|jgi:hypothetical protein
MDTSNKSKVKCLLCPDTEKNKWFKRLTGGHIEKIHDVTKEEYIKRFPGAKLISDQARELQSRIQKSLYENDKYKMNKGNRTFDFIKNKKLKSLLQRDYRTAKECLKYKLWKPCIILYGSIIEAVIIEFSSKSSSYYDALGIAKDKKLITEKDYFKIQMIRDLRNYVHLHKELKEESDINEFWAKTFSEICESVIRNFKK